MSLDGVRGKLSSILLICDKSVTTRNFGIFELLVYKENVCRCTFNRYSVIT